jgi:hypothetical protein
MGICPHDHHCVWQPRSDSEREMLHRPAAVRGLSFQWPHDDAGDWAEDFPELPPTDRSVPQPSELAQSPKETQSSPSTGLAEEVVHAALDDQTRLPDWMFELVGPRRP